MGLTNTLSNALSGLSVTQSSLDVLSRNVSNSGTPGYHRQSANIVDKTGTSGNYAIATTLTRAFNQSLQDYYTTESSDSGRSQVVSTYLNQLQTYLGKPGSTGSLDTVFGNFQTALSTLTAYPDDYSTRATTVSAAQTLASTLNHLTSSIQGLRQQASGQIQQDVASVNQALGALAKVNLKLGDLDTDAPSRAALLDQRDRLVAQVAGIVDLKATYRNDGTVGLATRAGVTLLADKPAVFSFDPVTNILPTSQYSKDDTQNGVGKLTIVTPAGQSLDLVKQGVLQGGELAGLIDLRDNLLVGAQGQLDGIAAGLAQAFSTNSTDGTTATGAGTTTGLAIDTSGLAAGNDVTLSYTVGGVTSRVRVVRVEDASKLPMNYLASDGTRIIGASFSGGAAGVASVLQQALGTTGLGFSGAGASLTVLNDGTANTKVNALTAHTTSTALQDAGLGLNLFVDGGNGAFTNSLDGAGQRLGFAGRITVNPVVVNDNTKLVQATSTAPIGDVARVNFLHDQLGSMAFSVPASGSPGAGGALSGTVTDLISQAMDFQGGTVAAAQSDAASHSGAMDALNSRMTSEYGVDINSEMARLVQLQAAYSANARIVTVAQNLVDALLQAVTG